MNGSIRVVGGNKLSGVVKPIPNKNSFMACIPASVLTDKPVTYHNVPDTSDIKKMYEILKKLGAKVSISTDKKNPQNKTVVISANSINTHIIDPELGGQYRSAIMFVGPLLARTGKARMPMPGGCTLGFRSVAAHIDAFIKAGVIVTEGPNYFDLEVPKKHPNNLNIWQKETSVTGTENLIMYLAGIDASSKVINAACEPHVQQLTQLLIDMGAKVDGIGSNVLSIQGNKSLESADFHPKPDFVDIAGYIVAAAITKGKITIKDSNDFSIVGGLINVFSKFNIKITESSNGQDLVVDGTRPIFIDTKRSGFPMAGNNLPKITPEPWPGFPVDVLPIIPTLASKAKGRLLVNNWMYETGLDFVRELNALGAEIFIVSPQKVIVNGPITFKGGEVVSPHVIQACKSLFLASLADETTTIIHGVDTLKRRYPNIFDVYRDLGAKIERLS